MYSKYEILVKVLDYICENSPEKFSRYRKVEEIEQNRSLAYIHLFLLVKFGIQDFEERHKYITDGTYDGGVDAFYIEREKKTIFLIQSKFRNTEINYENKDIAPDEIASMELERILAGEETDSSGNKFNGKITSFQKQYNELDGRSLYKFKVIILANLKHSTNLKTTDKLLKGFDYDVFDYEKAYEELLYPYCTSTYFQNGDIIIDENIDGIIEGSSTSFEHTSFEKCTVTMFFVPTIFVAEMIRKYKNSILVYNPRNYLSMSKNPVNKSIKIGIEAENEDFALMNNGITIVCSKCLFSKLNGLKDSTNIRIENPQIINGGQTAYTLLRIMEEKGADKLNGKKVLLKIISTYMDDKKQNVNEENKETFERKYLDFIYCISNATNYQTKIDGPDRRSNMKIQIDFQKNLYSKYGLLYERKIGEFEEAIHQKIIKIDQIIQRDILFRVITAIRGDSSGAMNSTKDALFSEENVVDVFDGSQPIHLIMYAYLVFKYAKSLERTNDKNPNELWGNGVKYGKYALVNTAVLCLKENDISKESYSELEAFAKKVTESLLDEWNEFENSIVKKKSNRAYFGRKKKEYSNYYKSGNSNDDIKEYWGNSILRRGEDTGEVIIERPAE